MLYNLIFDFSHTCVQEYGIVGKSKWVDFFLVLKILQVVIFINENRRPYPIILLPQNQQRRMFIYVFLGSSLERTFQQAMGYKDIDLVSNFYLESCYSQSHIYKKHMKYELFPYLLIFQFMLNQVKTFDCIYVNVISISNNFWKDFWECWNIAIDIFQQQELFAKISSLDIDNTHMG